MSLTVPNVYESLVAHRGSGTFPMNGQQFDQLARGIAQAVVQWGVGQGFNLGLTGMAVGTVGIGRIIGDTTKLVIPPDVDEVSVALFSAGLGTALSQALATCVALGISEAFARHGQYSGGTAGVGNGADTSRVTVANAITLIEVLKHYLGDGPATHQMAVGLGNGIAGLLMLGTGTGAVVGTAILSALVTSGPSFSLVV